MIAKVFFIILALFSASVSNAQLFIDKATIEYEVKANIQKTMGEGVFEDMITENLPV